MRFLFNGNDRHLVKFVEKILFVNPLKESFLKDNHTTHDDIVDESLTCNWDIAYKEIVDDIKSNIYKILLEYPIENEDDIVKIILNM